MSLLLKADCEQIKLSRKTTEGNLGPERSRLIREEDLEKTRKEGRSEWEAKRLERKTEREIRKKTGSKQEVEGEKGIKQ